MKPLTEGRSYVRQGKYQMKIFFKVGKGGFFFIKKREFKDFVSKKKKKVRDIMLLIILAFFKYDENYFHNTTYVFN